MSDDNVTVRNNPDANRYEVSVGGDLAGFSEYRLSLGRIDFVHTEVFEAFSGQGLAQRLAETSLEEAKEQGLAVLPYCPFYAKFIGRNREYVDLVPADRRAEFDLD